MEENIKNIISAFIQVPAEQINVGTIIDRSSVNSSIALHRMYAKLAEEGIVVDDYQTIRSFGNLLQRLNGNGHAQSPSLVNKNSTEIAGGNGHYEAENGVGIDIEEIEIFPKTNDFREDEFYKMNFAASEIAYCILQPNPYASFAGLFAAKEAIIKANNAYRSTPFSNIVINHLPEGKPVYPGFHLSIAHTNNAAIAVAVQFGPGGSIKKEIDTLIKQPSGGRSTPLYWLFIISFLISLLALYFALVN